MGDDIECIDDGKDPGQFGDLFAFKAGWIAGAIPAFVVVQDGFSNVFQLGRRFGQIVAFFGVFAHHVPFFPVQRSVLGQDFVWNSDLADIVQDTEQAQFLQLVVRQADGLADPLGKIAETAGMFFGFVVLFKDHFSIEKIRLLR